MDKITQNIDIPQDNNQPLSQPNEVKDVKKNHSKIIIYAFLFLFIIILLLSLLIIGQPKSKPTGKDTPEKHQQITQTPATKVDENDIEKLNQIKNKLNSPQNIPDLNIEEKFTF